MPLPTGIKRIPDFDRRFAPTREATKGVFINLKWRALNGSPGQQIGGFKDVGSGLYADYERGRIYWSGGRADAFYVTGVIGEKYHQLGGPISWLGWPVSDEEPFVQGGRVSRFEHGAIYWWSDTGATALRTGEASYHEYANGRIYYHCGGDLFDVYGVIGKKYIQLGGADSWLGWPTSSEQPFDQGGRVSTFERGAIYWWPDTEAIELGNVVVRYKGLYCFGETDEASEADEPYVIFGIVPVAPGPPLPAVQTTIYEDVDAGDSRPDNLELYRGLPYGITISALLMEHDEGDPNKYRAVVEKGVAAGSSALAAALAAIPAAGPFLAIGARLALEIAGPEIVNAVNDIIGSADDHIGTVSFHVSPKDLVLSTRKPHNDFWGIKSHIDSPLISDGEASYKVFIDVAGA